MFSTALVYFKLHLVLATRNLETYKENYSSVLSFWLGSQGSRAVPSWQAFKDGTITVPVMPDHDSTSLLSRQTKKRRVDIGVKRTVGQASVIFTQGKATFLSAMNPHGSEQDIECSVVQHADSEKSNVLRKLLKRANSYEDAMMPFPGATIISQLLKNNLTKNGGSETHFQGSGLSSTGSEIQQEDACSNSSRGSPQECLSPFNRPSMTQFEMERLTDEHLRAKRARVENIIRGNEPFSQHHAPCRW